MLPSTAQKLAEMGDITANKQKLAKALEFAKKNPDSPDSIELRKRLERGMFNVELKALGKKPFPVQAPKIDLSKAMASVQQVPAAEVSSMIPEAPKQASVGILDADVTETGLKERLGDVKETLFNVGEDLAGGAKKVYDIATDDDFTLAQKFMGTLGAGAGTVASAAGEAVMGAGKVLLTQEAEESLGKIVREAGQAVSESEIGKAVIPKVADWYSNLDKGDKLFVDSVGGMTAFMTELFGVNKAAKPVLETIQQAANVAEEVAPVVAKATVETAGDVASMVKNVVPDTTGLSESLIANVNRINPTKRQEFKMQQGVSEEEWLRTRGIIGTREQTIKQLAQNFKAIKDNVDEALDKIPGTYRDNRVTQIAEDSLEFAKATESTEVGRISELAQKAQGVGLTTSEINEIKRFYERNIKVGYLKDPTKTAEAVQRATNRDAAIREYLFEIADKNGFTNLRQLNKEIQANKFLADEIAGKAEGQNANNLMTLTDWIVASPAVVSDPSFIAGFIGKKLVSTETIRAFAAKALAGFPKVKDLPRADLDEITKRAQELLKKQEDLRVETEKNALLADELQKSGMAFNLGPQGFITENPIPLTRQEQALLRAAKAKDEYEQMLRYILDQKAQGNSVGEGFVIMDVQNTPILNPQSRFDPYREKTIDLKSETTESPNAPEEY